MKQNSKSTEGKCVFGSYSIAPLLCAKDKMLSGGKHNKSSFVDAIAAFQDTSPFQISLRTFFNRTSTGKRRTSENTPNKAQAVSVQLQGSNRGWH
jgi:hypothetical protein